jgi:mono/diheme cytochrome c family protein
MRGFSFPRVALLFFAGWTLWVAGNLIIADTGKIALTSQAFAASENTTDGLSVYRQFCLNCHGANGKGDDNMKKVMTSIPDFTSEKWQKEVSDPQMSVSITDGKGTLMPAFADKVKADQVQALVEYIREFDPARAK